MGVAACPGHSAYDVFMNSILFPFARWPIGIAIIGLGILWQKREGQITRRIGTWLPTRLRESIENVH